MVPVVVLLINKIPRKIACFASLYILSLLYNYTCLFFYKKTGGEVYLFLSRQLPGFMTYFISGIALNYYFDDFMKKKNLLVIIALIIFTVERYFKLEILTPLALAIIILFISYSFHSLNNFGKYGDFSYGIYIFHFPVIQTFVALGAFKNHNPWLVFCLIIFSVLLLAFISWNFIEKPFLLSNRQTAYRKPLTLFTGEK